LGLAEMTSEHLHTYQKKIRREGIALAKASGRSKKPCDFVINNKRVGYSGNTLSNPMNPFGMKSQLL